MNIFNQAKAKIQESAKLAQSFLGEYIALNADSKQITIGRKTVSLFCQQAESRIEQLNSLTPHPEEGLIASIAHKDIQAQIHFTPQQITLYENHIEGKILLLTPPQFETDSLLYRTLIAGWQLFLGGRIPDHVLPEGVKIDGDILSYTLPRTQLKVVDALFHTLKPGSTLQTSLKQGELSIASSIALTLDNINIPELLQTFTAKKLGDQQ
jgi:hypothetical protein